MADTQVNQTTSGDGGSNGGRGGLYVLVGIVVVLLVVVIILFVPGRTGNDTRDIDADIRIETPELPARDGGNGGTAPTDGDPGGG